LTPPRALAISTSTPLHVKKLCNLGRTPDVFTIDVEDWFHILEVPGTPDIASWDSLPTRLEANFQTLLELLAESDVKATCFALGWMARRFPKLLREAAEQGHDIASHGYGHQVVRSLSPAGFRTDIREAKLAIEDATGQPVNGYRAPGFSITEDTSWAIDEIIEAGYIFDSSVFPAPHGHGGIAKAPRHPYIIQSSAGRLVEFPVTVADTLFGPQCCFGGGYLRLIPLWIILAMAERVRSDQRGVIWYIHPREIDPGHPRLQMSLKRRFRSYVNLRSTAGKIRAILRTGNFVTFSELTASLRAEKVIGISSEPVRC
jgi:polysaccharide deacetylase family protein (PEP-CTERM system associated)